MTEEYQLNWNEYRKMVEHFEINVGLDNAMHAIDEDNANRPNSVVPAIFGMSLAIVAFLLNERNIERECGLTPTFGDKQTEDTRAQP